MLINDGFDANVHETSAVIDKAMVIHIKTPDKNVFETETTPEVSV
jgi:hypothetical protein